MPTVAYRVVVGVSDEVAQSANLAIAEASRFLGSCDTTDTMEFARVRDVETYRRNRKTDMDWGINLNFTVPIGLAEDKARFEQELETLAHVEEWQEIPVSNDDGLTAE